MLQLWHDLLFAAEAADIAEGFRSDSGVLMPPIDAEGIPLPVARQMAQRQRRVHEYVVGFSVQAIGVTTIGGTLLVSPLCYLLGASQLWSLLVGAIAGLVVTWRRRKHIRHLANEHTRRDLALLASRPTG